MVKLDFGLRKVYKQAKSQKPNQKRKMQSRSLKANLSFPVGRIHRYLKTFISPSNRISGKSAVFLAAVLEYLVAEIVELAGQAAMDFKMKRISPRHLLLAIRGDDELDQLIRATIANAGVLPQRKSLDESAFSMEIEEV